MTQTEKLLTDAFWQLLEEKPYKKITVRDIVDRCQVNRNTFYYHFEGIPSLLEQAIQEWEAEILQTQDGTGSPFSAVIPIAAACQRHRTAMLHLMNSRAWEDMVRMIRGLCRHAAELYVKTAAEQAAAGTGARIRFRWSEKDRSIMIHFYSAAISGCILTWLNAGMDSDLPETMPRVIELLNAADGSTEGHSQQMLTPAPKASGPV